MKRICIVIIVLWMSIAIASAQEDHWMPDANLRAAIREKLGLPHELLLTKENIKRLMHLVNCLEGEGIGTEPPDSPEN